MTNKILNDLNKIFRSYFNNDKINLVEKSTAKDVKGWDSLAQISLIVLIEKKFKMKFSVREISKLENVGGMVNLIKKNK
jgi:acyl carrier protein